MSKTDKTAPWSVKKARYGFTRHDHRDGVCNEGQVLRGVERYRACTQELSAAWWAEHYNYYTTTPFPKSGRKNETHKRRAADRREMQKAKYDPDDWQDTMPRPVRGLFGGGYWD